MELHKRMQLVLPSPIRQVTVHWCAETEECGGPVPGRQPDPAGLPPGAAPGGREDRQADAVRLHVPLPRRRAHHRRLPQLQVSLRVALQGKGVG